MGFGDGFRMGMGLLEQSAREKQQTQENAWKQKQMDAWQADQDFKTSERNNFLGLRSKAADAQEANDTAGFEAPGFNAPYAVESESGGYTGNGPVKLQIAPEQRTQQGMQRDFMRAAPDVQSVMALQEKATRDRAFNEGMALRSYLTSLPKETLDQHMGELSDSSRNGYKVQKTKGGYSVMVEGGEPIKMTRDQAMDWLSSRHVYNKTGDATALARMEKIDGVLASQAKMRFDQQKGATEAGNTATRYGNMDQKDAAQLGLQQQRLAQQSNAERMGQIQYFQDPKSEIGRAHV